MKLAHPFSGFPTNSERKEILSLESATRGLVGDVDFEFVARQTFGLTAADLAQAVEVAAASKTNGSRGSISTSDLLEGVRRVVRLPGRQGSIYGTHDKKKMAFAAAGRAVVAAALGRHNDLERVCILPSKELSAAADAPTGAEASAGDERSKRVPEDLVLAAAGTAAEKLFFGEPAAPLPSHSDQIKKLAHEMEGRLEVPSQQLIKAAEQQAAQIVSTYRSHVEAMASRLEEEEALSGPPLETMLEAVHREAELFGPPGLPLKSATNSNGHRAAEEH